jgi:uncharacterized protein Usg
LNRLAEAARIARRRASFQERSVRRNRIRAETKEMASKDFLLQIQGYGLTTAEIHYRMPDHPSLLQLYIWQEYDLAPFFPTLQRFLDYWRRELEGALHSVRVAHTRLIKPAEWRAVNGIIQVH